MPKDELVFVPDKESKRAEDWLRTTLISLIEQEIAWVEGRRVQKHDHLIDPKTLKDDDWRWVLVDISSTHAEAYNIACDDHIKHLRELIK